MALAASVAIADTRVTAELQRLTQSVAPSYPKARRMLDGCMKKTFTCTQCLVTKQNFHMLAPELFGANTPTDIVSQIVAQGPWARCLACQSTTNAAVTHHTASSSESGRSGMLCSKCKQIRPLTYFDAAGVKNRHRNKYHECRAYKTLTLCEDCGTWRPERQFRGQQKVCRTCQKVARVTCGACNKQLDALVF